MKTYKIALIITMLWSVGAWAGAADFVKKGDALLAQRKDVNKAREAIKEYQKALALDPSIVDAYWKISQAYYWLGIHVKDKSEKLKLFKNGIEFGKMCIQIDPKVAECHYWLGVAYGKYGEATWGGLQSLYLIPFMKKELKTTIKLNDKVRMYGAYSVLGWVNFKTDKGIIPAEKRGSTEKALKLLAKAVKLGPNNLVSRYFYARVLLAKDKKAEAIKQLQYIINAKVDPAMAPEFDEEKVKARKLLKEIQGK